MKTFEQDFKTNPSFNTVTGLTNTTFDPSNVVNNRGASEGQIKYVYDLIKALQDWLDENGCSDDPYAIIRQKVDELEEAIGVCCANPQDTLIQMLNDRLDGIETAMDTCCRAMDDNLYQMLVDRLDELEQSIEECCFKGGGGTGTCTGNTITVSFGWNGPNPFTDGGKATAVSADPSVQIAGFHFLVHAGPGTYVKKSTSGRWSIDGNGNVVSSAADGAGGYLVAGIVATDTNGCEGMTPVSLPQSDVAP